jgi:exosome complex RNA-binding protein Rrp4
MAIVLLIFVGVCGYIWWRTRSYRKLNNAKTDLTNAHVNKETDELTDQLTEMGEEHDQSTKED